MKKTYQVEFDLKVKIRSEVDLDLSDLDQYAKLRVAGDAGKIAFNKIAYSGDVDESIAFEIAEGIEIVIDPHEPTGLTYIKELRKPAPTGLAKLSIPVEDREHNRLEALRQRLEELQPIASKHPIFRAFWSNASASVTMAARHKKWYDDESIAEIERSVDFLERKLGTTGDQATEDPEQSRIKAIRVRLEALSPAVDPAVRTSAQLTNWWADCYGDLLRIETEEFVGTTYNIERLEKRVDEFEKTVEKRRERVEQA